MNDSKGGVMPQVLVKVEYAPNDIELTYAPSKSNNITDIEGLKNESNGAMPFLLGASKLGDNDRSWDASVKYDGYISGALTSATGESNVKIVITGEAVDRLIISFDSSANQYATEIIVDDEVYENHSNRFIWAGEPKNEHIIQIKKWSIPLYPVRITSIKTGLAIVYDNSQLQEVTRGSQCIANNSQPRYGALSQYGNITFIDKTGDLLTLAERGLLRSNQKIHISYGDIEIGNFTTEKWSFTVNNNKVIVMLNDSIVQWQSRPFSGIDMTENVTAWDVFLALERAIGEEVVLGDGVETRLKSVNIRYCELAESKLDEAVNKLCNLCQLLAYKNEHGKVTLMRWV